VSTPVYDGEPEPIAIDKAVARKSINSIMARHKKGPVKLSLF
jgi:hypothetical protein